jgi:pyruvate kinase
MLQQAQLEDLILRLQSIHNRMIKLERRLGKYIQNAHPSNRESARNLIDYLALRNLDLRNLQEQLSMLGLSSLGRTEAQTKVSLSAVLQVLHRLAGHDTPMVTNEAEFLRGKKTLAEHTAALLGMKPANRNTRIMVTLPGEAQDDYRLIYELISTGMNCARINCAHDDEQTWVKMVANIRQAAKEIGRECRILMDLGGPKPRIGATAEPILLFQGDSLVLRAGREPGQLAVHDEKGQIVKPASITCTLPQVFKDLQVGEAIMIEDGKVCGILRSVSEEEVRVEILVAKSKGSKLWGDEGLNFPDSKLSLGGMTPRDLICLDFVVAHADFVGLSFVNEPKDVVALQEELQKRNAQLGIVIKIETRKGFKQLPLLLLTAMRTQPIGVMIARGDLAIELGWERMSEVQEEILWLCEAGHVPAIWATQVLENLTKKGQPSRAEITDAAMAQRAECVMLNKGPFILEAVRTLDNILRRMQEHQNKKTAMLRSLKVCELEPIPSD